MYETMEGDDASDSDQDENWLVVQADGQIIEKKASSGFVHTQRHRGRLRSNSKLAADAQLRISTSTPLESSSMQQPIKVETKPDQAAAAAALVYAPHDGERPPVVSRCSPKQMWHSASNACRNQRWVRRFYRYAITEQSWFFLLGLGLLSATIGLTIDYAIAKSFDLAVWLSSRTDVYIVNYFVWIIYALPWCALSLSTVLYISPFAAGSGIPEMKSILSGIVSDNYLSFRTLVAKVIGLVAGFAGGLSIGKEGPFVHISSCIANLMMKLRIFRRIRRNDAVKLGVLAASCAVGVSTAFGAPVGGVLFSVEVTSTYYFVENLWKSIFCAVSSWFIVKLFHTQGLVEMFTDPSVASLDPTNGELGAYMVLGVFGGVFGSIIVKLLSGILKLALLPPFTAKGWQYLRVCAVGLSVALITFPFPELRNDSRSIISYLLTNDTLIGEWPVLVALILLKLIMTVLSVGFTGIPCGIYTPLFILGAIYGRFCGEILMAIFPGLDHHPTSYAIVGAAAIGAGATRTISTAVIVIELTGQVHLLLPILVAVLLSTAVGRFLSLSVYDVLVLQKGLPIMPTFRLQRSYNKTARDIMYEDMPYLTPTSTFKDVQKCLEEPSSVYPLVEDDDDRIFLGTVRATALSEMLNEIMLSLNTDQGERKILVPATPPVTHVTDDDEPSSNNSDFSNLHSNDDLNEDNSFISTTASSDSNNLVSPIDSNTTLLNHPTPPVIRVTDDDEPSTTASSCSSDDHTIHVADSKATTEIPIGSHPTSSSNHPVLAVEDPLDIPVPYVFTTGAKTAPEGSIDVDTTTFTLDSATSLYKVHYIFTMLGVSSTFITCRGRLVGKIDKTDIIDLNLDQFDAY